MQEAQQYYIHILQHKEFRYLLQNLFLLKFLHLLFHYKRTMSTGADGSLQFLQLLQFQKTAVLSGQSNFGTIGDPILLPSQSIPSIVIYLISVRIDSAKFLLKTTPLSIKEIGFQCGFSSESSFNTTFKKRCGISPGQYRNEK